MLSLVAALACIPLAYWAARSLFGRTAGWVAATLATVDPPTPVELRLLRDVLDPHRLYLKG